MSYLYSHPSALDNGDDFHVLLNGVVQREYDTDPGISCELDGFTVSEGDTLVFKCKSGGEWGELFPIIVLFY